VKTDLPDLVGGVPVVGLGRGRDREAIRRRTLAVPHEAAELAPGVRGRPRTVLAVELDGREQIAAAIDLG
jgi:hypothetical protein